MSLQCKAFEVRDAATFIPCFGIRCEVATLRDNSSEGERDAYLLRRAGYGADVDPPCVLFGRLDTPHRACYDPYDWGQHGGRTMPAAHEYVVKHWDSLVSGAVIDVQFILDETREPRQSEALWCPNVDVETMRATHSPPPGVGKVSLPEIDFESLEQHVKEKIESAEPGELRAHRQVITRPARIDYSWIEAQLMGWLNTHRALRERASSDPPDACGDVHTILAREFGVDRRDIKNMVFNALYQPDSQQRAEVAGGVLPYLRQYLTRLGLAFVATQEEKPQG